MLFWLSAISGRNQPSIVEALIVVDDPRVQIGTFLTAFNEIEAQSYVVLHLLADDELRAHALSINQFQARVRMLQALLRSSTLDRREEFYTLFNEAIAFAKLRNRLSHNPLRVLVSQNIETREIRTTYQIEHSMTGEAIPDLLGHLTKNIDDIQRIALRLEQLTAEYTIAARHLPSRPN